MGEGNLELFNHELKKGLNSLEFNKIAIENFEQFGMMQGFQSFRESILNRIPEDKRSDPNIDRFAVLVYNQALKDHQINDQLGLYYHYTDDAGVEGIQKDGRIRALGKVWKDQMKEGLDKQGVLGAIKALVFADNLEKVGIHVASAVPPEKARPNYTSIPDLFIQRIKGLFGNSMSLGIREEQLKNYFTIVTPLSDNIFSPTIQSKIPGFGLNERRSSEAELPIGINDKYMILGPFDRIPNPVQSNPSPESPLV